MVRLELVAALFLVLLGGHAGVLAEHLGKIALILITHAERHVHQLDAVVEQQLLGFFDAQPVEKRRKAAAHLG